MADRFQLSYEKSCNERKNLFKYLKISSVVNIISKRSQLHNISVCWKITVVKYQKQTRQPKQAWLQKWDNLLVRKVSCKKVSNYGDDIVKRIQCKMSDRFTVEKLLNDTEHASRRWIDVIWWQFQRVSEGICFRGVGVAESGDSSRCFVRFNEKTLMVGSTTPLPRREC